MYNDHHRPTSCLTLLDACFLVNVLAVLRHAALLRRAEEKLAVKLGTKQLNKEPAAMLEKILIRYAHVGQETCASPNA